MYYQLEVSIMDDYGVTNDPALPVGISFQKGGTINQPLELPLKFLSDTTEENPPSDYTSMVIPVFSDRLIEALEQAGVDNLQTFASILENPVTGESWTDYKAVNVIGLVDCANMRRSKYSTIGGDLVSFRKLVIDALKAKDALMFRLFGSPDILLVHEQLKTHILAQQPELTGIDFKPVQTR